MANIVICADGTWNRPEDDLEKDHATNVLKLARAIKPKAKGLKQHVFYDWGVGSYYNGMGGGITGSGIQKILSTPIAISCRTMPPTTKFISSVSVVALTQ